MGTGFQSVKEKFFAFMARLMCHKAKQKWNILAVQKGVGYKRHIGIHFAPDAAQRWMEEYKNNAEA